MQKQNSNFFTVVHVNTLRVYENLPLSEWRRFEHVLSGALVTTNCELAAIDEVKSLPAIVVKTLW